MGLRDAREIGPVLEADAARFWSKVALPDENGCMLWLGTITVGYGVISVQNRQIRAHRLSLVLAGQTPSYPSLEAAHSCRNRHCVAPAHLRWATRRENDADKDRDGTYSRGERHGAAKLTDTQVLEMRRLYVEGWSQAQLRARYGRSRGLISMILAGKVWRHLLEDAS